MTRKGKHPVDDAAATVVTRVVASPAALDRVLDAAGRAHLRLAHDEALVFDDAPLELDDEWAIVERDTSWVMTELPHAEAADFFAAHASWPPPTEASPSAQGKLAGIAVKTRWTADRMIILHPAAYSEDFELRTGVRA